MESLSQSLLKKIEHPYYVPEPTLPETILQFGTGALLRGLIDYFLQQAHEQKLYKGKVVMVGSTGSGRSNILEAQEGLFMHRIEGFESGNIHKSFALNGVCSRALSAQKEWDKVLDLARSPDLQLIVSNTTEVGIRYEEDDLTASPPTTFPAKLTACLLARFHALGGTAASGLVIIPTELILDNGEVLRECVLQHAEKHELNPDFSLWVEEHVLFCNSLVDRIVTGTPRGERLQHLWEELGFEDKLLTISEPYRLWAIQGPESLKERLPFLTADSGMVVTEDILPFRERKLRILNGAHSLLVGLGHLYGLSTVRDCMESEEISRYLQRMMQEEIVPSLPAGVLEGVAFAEKVLDRFRNPFLQHRLLDISLYYTSKIRMRTVVSFERYYRRKGEVPPLMCLGFAAYLLFMKPIREESGQYFGYWGGEEYLLRDDQAGWFYKKWQELDEGNPREWVEKVLGEVSLWGQDLNQLEGMLQLVTFYLESFRDKGIHGSLREALQG